MESIIGSVRSEVRGSGLMDTRENCWRFFIDRVRRQLKVKQSESRVQPALCVLHFTTNHPEKVALKGFSQERFAIQISQDSQPSPNTVIACHLTL